MLRDLLWLWEAKMQYERQKAQGLAGLIALLTVILVMWKWNDWFYPLAKNFGIIDFLKRTGLWHENEVMTIINVLAVIFLLSLFIGLIAFGCVFLLGLIGIIFNSKVGQYLLVIGLFPILFPLLYFSARKNRYDTHYRKSKEKRALLLQYKDLPENERRFNLLLHQLEEQDSTFSYEKLLLNYDEARERLNKVLESLQDDTDWLIGYDKNNDKYYLIFPNPLPMSFSRSFLDEYFTKKNYRITGHIIDSVFQHSGVKKNHFYTPCISLKIDWNWSNQQFLLAVEDEIKERNILYTFGDFQGVYYKLNGKDIRKFHDSLLSKWNVKKALEQTHIAYYSLQILLKYNEGNKFFDGYLEEFKHIPNAKEYAPIYEEKVVEDIERRAWYGEEWAKAYLREVKNGWPKDNVIPMENYLKSPKNMKNT